MKFLLIVLFAAIAFAQTTESTNPEKCPLVKNIVIKRVQHVVIPINVPYPVYKEIPFDGKPIKDCPPHFKRTGNRCTHIVHTTDVCPTQYSRISDDECIRVIIIDTIDQHASSCPEGYKFDKEKGCVQVNFKYPKLPPLVFPKTPDPVPVLPPLKPIKCPKGYLQVGNYRCKKVLGCPKGTKKVKGKCISQVQCKAGEIVILGTCVKTTKCPFGYALVKGVCMKGKKPCTKCPKPEPKCNESIGIKTIVDGFTTITKVTCSGTEQSEKISNSFIGLFTKGQTCSGINTALKIEKSFGNLIQKKQCSGSTTAKKIETNFDNLVKKEGTCTGEKTTKKIRDSFGKIVKSDCKTKGEKKIMNGFKEILKPAPKKQPLQ